MTFLLSKILIAGDSCYPLSPLNYHHKKSTNAVSKNDQLLKIIELLGEPADSDLDFLSNESKRSYVRKACSCKNLQPLFDHKF